MEHTSPDIKTAPFYGFRLFIAVYMAVVTVIFYELIALVTLICVGIPHFLFLLFCFVHLRREPFAYSRLLYSLMLLYYLVLSLLCFLLASFEMGNQPFYVPPSFWLFICCVMQVALCIRGTCFKIPGKRIDNE